MTVGASESATLKQSASPSAFVFAREFGERASEINDFYNAFTGRSRSLAAYHWEFQAGPGGPALIWTIVDSSSHRVVGHHSIIPTPLVVRGTTIAGGRTENTIIDPAVRHKVFYPGMEKKALTEALHALRVIYTIHSTGPAKLRLRLGYRPVGRWIVYLPKVGPAYLHALLKRGCSALSLKVPAAMLAVLAAVTGRLHSAVAWLGRQPRDFEVAEISDITVVAQEYERFWNRARQRYDLTIDRSLDFLRWRVVDNPHLHFRTWALRRRGDLEAIVIGHRHRLGGASALYIDDIIVGEYGDASFAAVLSSLPDLDPSADATVVMTLAVDTPLYRVLRRRFRLQSLLLDRFGHALFDEMVALDKDGVAGDGPWYVTPIFTEGMDTSRNEQADSGTPA